ncbi:hypothetical protein [Henriciella sp.]|uniref:hypothetical protein n=1 Tax=Henriciella sp. TaxID=1968823 RepID=UPI0026034C6C|nr:hypothetical protein [Henriciella sp.]
MILPAAMVLLAGCNGQEAQTPPSPEDMTIVGSAVPEVLQTGEYCYFRDDAEVTEGVRLIAGGDGSLSGRNYGVIHQEGEGYYSAFEIDLNGGRLTESGLVLFNANTRVEGDVRSGTMLWNISEDSAAPDGLDTKLDNVACDGLEDRVFPENQ